MSLGLHPTGLSRLRRSRIDLKQAARELTSRILHTNEVGSAGVYLTRNPVEIPPNGLAAGRNMFRYDGALQAFPGNAAKGVAGLSLTPTMGIFNLIGDGSGFESFKLDQRNLYRWNTATDLYDVVWENYTKGTVDQVTAANPAVITGNAGTDWQSRDATTGTRVYGGTASTGDLFKLAADADDKFTAIATVGADTSLTLVGAYPGTTGGPGLAAAYVIRKRFRGTASNFFAWTEFQNSAYLSNGVDSLKRWDSVSLALTSVADSTTPGNVPAAAGLETYAERIIAWGIADYARATADRYMIAWCAATDPTDWTGTGSGSRYFLETPGGVQSVKRMDENLLVYKEYDIWFGVRTGGAEPPFSFEPKITSPRHGLLAPRSVVSIDGARHLYLGQDDFYMLTPFRAQRLSDNAIRDVVFGLLDVSDIVRVQGDLLHEYRMVGWLLTSGAMGGTGTAIVLYDYNADVWFGPIDPLPNREVYSIGHFRDPGESGVAIDDLVGTIDAQTFVLGGSAQGIGRSQILFGEETAQIYAVDDSVDAYAGVVRTPSFSSAAVYTNTPLEESVAVRVTLVYEVPIQVQPSTVIVSISDGVETLGTEQRTLESSPTGSTRKAYFDFMASAERLQAHVSATATSGALKVLELALDVTAAGREEKL